MDHATVTNDSTISADEARRFGAMARDWWDPRGTSALLHRLNPVRLRYIRDAADRQWGGDPAGFTPLSGKRALDVGCGAGLLSEPLARLGAAVTGVDAAPETIAVALAHAEGAGLAIDYRAGGVDGIEGSFDLVTCLEVIEHVADRTRFVEGLAARLAPDGLLIVSTPNRTAVSRLALITVAEGTGRIPRGTHDWSRFLTPDELGTLLGGVGLDVIDTRGLVLGAGGFALGESTALDYFVTAVRRT